MPEASPNFPADQLVQTTAERVALDALRDVSSEVNGQMERHCVRQFRIAVKMAEDLGLEFDRELLCCSAFLHDAGLFPGASTGGVYTNDGRLLAVKVIGPFDWEPARMAVLLDSIEQHHSFRSRWDWGTEVELMRRSDLVEVIPRIVTFGVSRAWLRNLYREMSRTGFYRHIWSQFVRGLKERPTTIPGMFRPPAEPTDPTTLARSTRA